MYKYVFNSQSKNGIINIYSNMIWGFYYVKETKWTN